MKNIEIAIMKLQPGCHCRNRIRRMKMKDKRTRKEQHVDQVICYDGLEACCSKKAKEWFGRKPYGKVRKDDDRAEH